MSDIPPLTALSGIFLSVTIESSRAELKLRPYVIPSIPLHSGGTAVLLLREERRNRRRTGRLGLTPNRLDVIFVP